MKVTLVVASGVHQGKAIPIAAPQFYIGRDAQCHLRPASQAISKRHCGVILRDGKVFVQDFGSTNGTMVNDALVKNAEVEVQNGASLKLGPLDFTIKVEYKEVTPDSTPLPDMSDPNTAAALAAVKASSAAATVAPTRDATPNPSRPAKPASSTGSKEAPALKPQPKPASETPSKAPAATPSGNKEQDEHDAMAAMLMGMDDEPGEVPDGSTVMDMPNPLQGMDEKGGSKQGTAEDKGKEGDKKTVSREDMTNAASELLRKMMRRPK